ncbi:MAG: hypothetical protein J1E35_02895 [Lachnospiraceae bacterium]|nr:hypothetical protein [Lachnospiraceae bacterium]
MKKRIGTTGVILVLAVGIIALYLYIDRSGKKETEPVNTAAEQILSKNLDKNYPPTPHAVAELYCGIIECIYSEDTTEEQLEKLVKMQLRLFDEEFAALNPYEQFLAVTKEELAEAAEKKLVFTGYVVDRASNVEKWRKNSVEYASIGLEFTMRSGDGRSIGYRNLVMRKDADGRYKILGWQTAEDGGGGQ